MLDSYYYTIMFAFLQKFTIYPFYQIITIYNIFQMLRYLCQLSLTFTEQCWKHISTQTSFIIAELECDRSSDKLKGRVIRTVTSSINYERLETSGSPPQTEAEHLSRHRGSQFPPQGHGWGSSGSLPAGEAGAQSKGPVLHPGSHMGITALRCSPPSPPPRVRLLCAPPGASAPVPPKLG